MQDKEKLAKYFTQNIDGLERLAGTATVHSFLCLLEERNKHMNMIDTPFWKTLYCLLPGLRDEKIVEAHGTFSSSACSNCGAEYDIKQLRQNIMADKDTVCPKCGGWVKPKIVFFGEQLPKRFFDEAEMDCTFCDLLVCIGTSLEVEMSEFLISKPMIGQWPPI